MFLMRGESLWFLNLKAWIPLDELEAVYGFLDLDRYTRIDARWAL